MKKLILILTAIIITGSAFSQKKDSSIILTYHYLKEGNLPEQQAAWLYQLLGLAKANIQQTNIPINEAVKMIGFADSLQKNIEIEYQKWHPKTDSTGKK